MMANRKKSNESSRSASKNARRHVEGAMFSSSSSEDEAEVTTGCRSCRNTSKEHFTRPHIETNLPTAGGQDGTRREENPFSFKHFLKNGAQPSYHNTGARPKVYSPPASSPNNLDKDTAVYSRNPTELPDFVQDHLVIEQCYLNHESNKSAMPDVDNLPDFTLNSMEQRQTRLRNESKKCEASNMCDLPFDLTGSLDKGALHRDRPLSNAARSAHLDLPAFDRSSIETSKRPESSGFPLDLPLPLDESDSTLNNATRDCSVAGESGVPKSLPDFLNDGPIHNRTALSTDPGSTSNISETTERRLLLEIERLRHELDGARKQISEKNKRIHLLESELASRKESAQEQTMHLGKTGEHGDNNLKRNMRRDASGESTVATLKKEIKTLTTEVSLLRGENMKLRADIAAAGGNEYSSSLNVDRTIRRLAGDLRSAASSAEISLRQLMSGVDNLRVLASTLESVDRIEDRTKDFLPDFDEDNAAGPAL